MILSFSKMPSLKVGQTKSSSNGFFKQRKIDKCNNKVRAMK